MHQIQKNMHQPKFLNKFLFILFVNFLPLVTWSQDNNYWTRSFNEESSLLSGSVVGGGAGPSAIYYNPASISEISKSSFSINASLFAFNFLNANNALGDSIHLDGYHGGVTPRFISYMYQPKKHPRLSFEAAYLSTSNYELNITQNADIKLNVINRLNGDERYLSTFNYHYKYTDDWVGVGTSFKITPHVYLGSSMFLSLRVMNYSRSIDNQAYAIDSSAYSAIGSEVYAAQFSSSANASYYDYGLIFKGGALYHNNRFSFGVNITAPIIDGLYTGGEYSSRKRLQNNIFDPASGLSIPDYFIVDSKTYDDVEIKTKTPLAIATGLNYELKPKKLILYSTFEYFFKVKPYKSIQANESNFLIIDPNVETVPSDEYLTYVAGASAILNGAIGIQWNIAEQLIFYAGYRTDFNYVKHLDYGHYAKKQSLQGFVLDYYHLTGGLVWQLRGNNLITGFQYTRGSSFSQEQFINVSNPVEYNYKENAALQGDREKSMNTFANYIAIYFGATFKFGGN